MARHRGLAAPATFADAASTVSGSPATGKLRSVKGLYTYYLDPSTAFRTSRSRKGWLVPCIKWRVSARWEYQNVAHRDRTGNGLPRHPGPCGCTQADLTGLWRFVFDTGYKQTGEARSDRLSCFLQIKGNGVIVPRRCETVNESGDRGDFIVASSNRRLRMKANTCEVMFSGAIVFPHDFKLTFGTFGTDANGASRTISPNKDMMLGWLSYNGRPHVAVTAIRRATP
jgi:hypothetical protein